MLDSKEKETKFDVLHDDKYDGYFKITTNAVNIRVKPGMNKKDEILYVLMKGETVHCYGKYVELNGEIYLPVERDEKHGYLPLKFAEKIA